MGTGTAADRCHGTRRLRQQPGADRKQWRCRAGPWQSLVDPGHQHHARRTGHHHRCQRQRQLEQLRPAGRICRHRPDAGAVHHDARRHPAGRLRDHAGRCRRQCRSGSVSGGAGPDALQRRGRQLHQSAGRRRSVHRSPWLCDRGRRCPRHRPVGRPVGSVWRSRTGGLRRSHQLGRDAAVQQWPHRACSACPISASPRC